MWVRVRVVEIEREIKDDECGRKLCKGEDMDD
jgi:hypothetical protein